LAYNHPVTKATGASLPGELLITLSSLADTGGLTSDAGTRPGFSRMPAFPFLTSGQFLDDEEAVLPERR
jgi:hypothetical protein